MEAKDSSAALAAAALAGSKDGPVSDEGHLSDAKGLAKEAAFLFQSRRFHECVDVLNQLLQKKRDDGKVLHNIAVADYFRDGCSDPKNLLDVLNKVKEQSEDLAHSSGEQIESGNISGNNMVSGSKMNSTSPNQISAINSGRMVYAQEFDTSVTMLNIAVVLYHVHEYGQALSVLETLYQNIEPIDERIALHVCLLLLDVALACQDASKAADVIQYLEKSFGIGHAVGQGDNGNSIQQQSNQGLKVASMTNISAPDASSIDSSGSGNVLENALARTLPDETLEYETLYSTLDSTENLERPTPHDNTKLSADQAGSAIDLKLNVHLYKVRLLLLARNLKAAKREIKLAMNIARFGDSSTVLLLKSQLEYARGNHRKAIKLLMTSSNRSDQGMFYMFNNNMGCIYHQLGKHHTSTLFFCKALKCSASLRSEKPFKLSTLSQDKSLFIVYNCGLQYLLCGRPLVAARCFDKTRPIFYNKPILWLRFAECCLSALEKGLLRRSGASSSNGEEEVKVHVVGSGGWRRLVIDEFSSAHRYLDCLGEDGLITSDGQHRLSLPFARRCLVNALYLLNNTEKVPLSASLSRKEEDSNQVATASAKNSSHKNVLAGDSKTSNSTLPSMPASNGDSKETKGGIILNMTLQSSLSSYEEICRKENNMIKQAVLGNLAYVELSLGNPLKALSAAEELQQLPNCSKMYIFLSHVYAAEALCNLNRPKEAAEHLSFYVSEKNEVQLPYSDEDREKWRVDRSGDNDELNGPQNSKTSEVIQGTTFLKPEEARGVLYANLAAISAIQGNVEQASLLVKKALSALPNNPRAALAAIYVDLLLGRTQDAVVKLRQCRHVRFFPARVTMGNT